MLDNNITQDRDKYIGGSDLPKIIYSSNLYKLALEKLNPNFKGNEYTHYGHFMEPLIRDYINHQYDYDFRPDVIFHDIYRANCDGIDTHVNKLIEIKTCGHELNLQYYMPQLQCYLHLFNVETCLVVAYYRPHNFFFWGDITNRQSYNLNFDEHRIEVYTVTRNKKLWQKFDHKAQTFAYALNQLKKTSFSIHADKKDKTYSAEYNFNKNLYGSQFLNLLPHFNDYKSLEKLIRKQDIYKAQIGDWHVKRTDISKFGVDVERLAQEMPEIFEEYKIVENTRKIEVRRNKNATDQ